MEKIAPKPSGNVPNTDCMGGGRVVADATVLIGINKNLKIWLL